jgi:hypothetical protein
MTWLSRLLPQSPNVLRLANNNPRTRQAQRRRRSLKLEFLENRTLLSNVTTSFNSATSALTITGDTSNDNFTITELANGTVTVAPGATKIVTGVGVVAGSTINTLNAPFNTGNPVASISVSLPGSTNFDFISLTGPGKAVPTTVGNVTIATTAGANIGTAATPGLVVNGVENSGNFIFTSTASPAPPSTAVNAVVTAKVDNSSFATLSIAQSGYGPDSSSVELGSDTVPGTVSVSLGDASGDSITLDAATAGVNDSFGATTLTQGNTPLVSPPNANELGNSDIVTVGPGSYKSLTVHQLLNGTNNTISVGPGPVVISPFDPTTAPGVLTTQGNGTDDTTTINGVTTSGPAPPLNLPLPPGFVVSSISVTQGTGNVGVNTSFSGVNDQATVENSVVPGNISITQGDVAGNTPRFNIATISSDTAGGSISISQGNAGGEVLKGGALTQGDTASVTGSKAGTSITISQGTGINDSATVSGSTAGGNVLITQADVLDTSVSTPTGDTASITGGSIGGNATISQGAANGDSATVNVPTVGGNVLITQGNGNGDSATVTVTTVGGNVSITQGGGNGDIAIIDPASVGGNITISQGGGDGDSATVSPVALDVEGNVTITQLGGDGDSATIENITETIVKGSPSSVTYSISQGSGNGDSATVSNVSAPNGNVSITQADSGTNAAGDTALVVNVTIGTSPGGVDTNGNVTISQGNAPGDVALVQGGASNNIAITQGLNVQTPNGSSVATDVAEINDTAVTSDITITQGNANSAAGGLYVAAIGFDYLGDVGTISPPPGSSSVTAGGITAISQGGANNQVFLGDDSDGSSFTTTFLDVFTGLGGGAFVEVQNTFVFFGAFPLGGPFSSVFNIEGGGSGNTISLDLFSSATVTFDPANVDGGVV